jgi:hypothetical protein
MLKESKLPSYLCPGMRFKEESLLHKSDIFMKQCSSHLYLLAHSQFNDLIQLQTWLRSSIQLSGSSTGNQWLLRVSSWPNPCHKDSFEDKINYSFCLRLSMITHDFYCSKVMHSF